MGLLLEKSRCGGGSSIPTLFTVEPQSFFYITNKDKNPGLAPSWGLRDSTEGHSDLTSWVPDLELKKGG